MAERVRVREISNAEGSRLLRMVRRSSGSVVTWRRAQMVLLSAQGMDVAMIAQVTFTSPDRVRDVLHSVSADGFDSLRPKDAGGRPPTFATAQREQITQTALARPTDHGLPFSTWSLLDAGRRPGRAGGGLWTSPTRGCARSFAMRGSPVPAVRTWKTSTGPDDEAKKNRVLALSAIADGKTEPGADGPTVVICLDELGPLNLPPHRPPLGAGRGRIR